MGRARTEGQPACDASLQGLVVAAAPGATAEVPACLYRESVAVNKTVTFEAAGAERSGLHSGAMIPVSWVGSRENAGACHASCGGLGWR